MAEQELAFKSDLEASQLVASQVDVAPTGHAWIIGSTAQALGLVALSHGVVTVRRDANTAMQQAFRPGFSASRLQSNGTWSAWS